MNLTLLPTKRNVPTWEDPSKRELLLKLRELQAEIVGIRNQIQKDREWMARTIQTLSEHNPHTGYSSDQIDPDTLESILRQSYQRLLQTEERVRRCSSYSQNGKPRSSPANFHMRSNMAR